MARFLTVGESMGWVSTPVGNPLSAATQLDFGTAGAEATVAIGVARLGHEACWCGVVGDDPIGDRLVRDLRADLVDTTAVRRHTELPTGFMVRDRRTPDETVITYYRVGLAGSTLSSDDVDAAFDCAGDAAYDWVHLSSITAGLSTSGQSANRRAIERAHETGAKVSFDVNFRSRLWSRSQARAYLESVLPQIDLLFAGDDELDIVRPHGAQESAQDSAHELLAAGPSEVVIKQGPTGAYACTSDTDGFFPAYRVTVADTIGAGDGFAAGYLAAHAEGLNLAERLRWATICAACTVGTHGDSNGLPDRARLEQFGGGSVRR